MTITKEEQEVLEKALAISKREEQDKYHWLDCGCGIPKLGGGEVTCLTHQLEREAKFAAKKAEEERNRPPTLEERVKRLEDKLNDH